MTKFYFTYDHKICVGNGKHVECELEGVVDYERDHTLNIALCCNNKLESVCAKTDLYKEIVAHLNENEVALLSECYEYCTSEHYKRDVEVARELRA